MERDTSSEWEIGRQRAQALVTAIAAAEHAQADALTEEILDSSGQTLEEAKRDEAFATVQHLAWLVIAATDVTARRKGVSLLQALQAGFAGVEKRLGG